MSDIHNPLHSSNGSDSIWKDSKLSLKFKNRTELYITLTIARKWDEICLILNDIPENDIRSLATVLNDCPQWARVIALKQLKATDADYYKKCMSAITKYQLNKAFFDPENTFPYVATDQFFKCFKEGDTLAWTISQIKSQYYSTYHIPTEICQTSNLENIAAHALKIWFILDSIAEQLPPSDITNLLVVIGHVPTNRWRHKYMNLFRQLPEHYEWIEQMRRKEYDITLVGSDVRKLGQHISNSFKYPIDIITVWLAVVPAAQYLHNYWDLDSTDAWRLYSDGNIYKDELMNDNERADFIQRNGHPSPRSWYRFYRSRQDFKPQNNMFATPEEMANERQLELPGFNLYSNYSDWFCTHNVDTYRIKVLFYLGTEYREESGTQLAVARFYQETVQPWRPRSFHPPLITYKRGGETPLLYYYKFANMQLRSSPQRGWEPVSSRNITIYTTLTPAERVSYYIPLDEQ